MADDSAAQQAAGTVETKADFEKSPKDFTKNWMTAIEMAGTDEKQWREDAEAALKTYRVESDKGRSYNILYANTQTKVPALYNSEPTPDIRRRFGDTDPTGAPVVNQAYTPAKRCANVPAHRRLVVSRLARNA